MEHSDNLIVSPNGENIQLQNVKAFLFKSISSKFLNHLQIVSGMENDRKRWGKVIVDWGKNEIFLEQCSTGFLDNAANYGKILDTGYGENCPQYSTEVNQFFENFNTKIKVMKVKSDNYEKTYYVMSDVPEILTASSVEEIKRYGKILYSSRLEDPPESLISVIEDGYFGLAEYNSNHIDKRIFDAAQKNQTQIILKYLQEGGDINSTDEYGWTLLHHAAVSGHVNMIHFLKEKNADMQARDKMCGRIPAHIAAREGHCDALSFFFRNGIDVNSCDKNDFTLLHYAAFKGDSDTVRFLLRRHSARINVAEISVGKYPIHIAAEYGNINVLEVLLENGAGIEDVDSEGRTPLYFSALANHLDASKYLIERGANVDVKSLSNCTLLHAAVKTNSKPNIEFFIDTGFININEKDRTDKSALLHAAINGCYDAVQILVERNANLSDISERYLDFIENRHVDVFLYLTDKMCTYFKNQNKHNDALKLYKKAFLAASKKWGPEHMDTLEAQNKLGIMLTEMGQYNEATNVLKDVLSKRERSLGATHVDTLRTKHGMGLLLAAQINYDEAYAVLKDVHQNLCTISGDEHYTTDILYDVADVLFKRGKYEEAYPLSKEVFEKRNSSLGSDHPKTLEANEQLAGVLANRGEVKTAHQMLKDILKKRQLVQGSNHSDILLTMKHLSKVSEILENKEKGQGDDGCSIQ